MKSRMRKRRGFALVFVLLITAAMMIPVLILLSSLTPRRTAVQGEAVSDRVLSLTDSTIDNILTQVNTFPFNMTATSVIEGAVEGEPDSGTAAVSNQLARNAAVYYWVAMLNGGVVPSVPDAADSSAVATFNASCASIAQNVATYLYNLNTGEYYVLWDTLNTRPANVAVVGPAGDITTGTLKNLGTGAMTTLAALDTSYASNNIWAEIDTNADYVSDQWNITATSYLLSRPDVKRTVKAVASRGALGASSAASDVADGSWFTHDTATVAVPGHSFADYSGLFHTKAYFGQYETTTGPIRSDGNLYMGGWAHDPVFANGRVYDEATDDYNGNHDGRFGPDQKNLTWAKANAYATDGYPTADWAAVDRALTGSSGTRKTTDPQGGMQDKALPDYYVNGSATVVFNADGTVTINGANKPMPANGIIYVEGTATVSGNVKGQWTVGASKIDIGGNIVYVTPPRTDRNAPVPANPDLLGLVSHGDITITTSTFNNNHHLRIDAAMISAAGNFGIDANAPSHTIDPTGTFEGTWNGCQACWNTSNAPAMYLGGNKVRGYEVQHTLYDWNLRDYGVPPMFPTTSVTGEDTDLIDQWPIVTDSAILAWLQARTKDQLTTPSGFTDYPYKYYYNGTWYYYGGAFNYAASVTAGIQKTSMYRISWKEQVAQPVEP